MVARESSSIVSDTDPVFVDDEFPLVVCISPRRHDERAVRLLAEGYERYFTRGKKYALITATPRDAITMGARERKAIADWAGSPRVRQKSSELCVGSATLVKDNLAKGALTAILWLWKPASPHHVATTPEEAVDWCIAQLQAAGVPMPSNPSEMRRRTLRLLHEVV